MAEYIEREALRNAVRKKTFTKYDWSEEIDFEDFEKVLDGLPAADVATVVHGRWIDTGLFNSYKSPIYECSACHEEVYDHYIKCHKFCLHCGAKMDLEG